MLISSGKLCRCSFLYTLYRVFAFFLQGPTQQIKAMAWRPCRRSRQKSVINILLNWNTNMAAVTSCANALYVGFH
jgi:hypothetical protein